MAQEKEKREVTKTGGVIIEDPQLVDIKTKKGEVMPALNLRLQRTVKTTSPCIRSAVSMVRMRKS